MLLLSDDDLMFVFEGTLGVPLVWVIDGQCLYDLPLYPHHADIFLNHDSVVDVSADYPEHDGIAVGFVRSGDVFAVLKTSEYFGSILLSEPLVLNLFDYPNGVHVMSPYALFDGEQFIILEEEPSE